MQIAINTSRVFVNACRGAGALAAVSLSTVLLAIPSGALGDDPVRFNRDIRPILWENCVVCHGPDARKEGTKLRLDSREGATADLGGEQAVVPGDLDASVLWKRISSKDDNYRMPPPESRKKLEDGQRELLRRWILSGAEYEGHWAYLPVERPEAAGASERTGSVAGLARTLALPSVARREQPPDSWPLTAIDCLVLPYIEAAGFTLSDPADPVTLVRRLHIDLTGMIPSNAEVAAYTSAPGPEGYEALVDRLLASPRFGERMAVFWLDLVRYADTIGYHSDNPMPVAAYREYVIRSFNENLPFDQFTREQLAGDLLEDSCDRQLVASAYNRINQKTEEGGAQAKEYRAIMQADRVRNVSEVWLGATMGCAQCHDHKYDPFTMRDFYSMGAFFADLDAPDIYRRETTMGATLTLLDDAEKARLDALWKEVDALKAAIGADSEELDEAQRAWEAERLAELEKGGFEARLWIDDAALIPGAKLRGRIKAIGADAGPVFQGKTSRLQTGEGEIQHRVEGLKSEMSHGDVCFADIYIEPEAQPKELRLELSVAGESPRHAYWAAQERKDISNEGQWHYFGPIPEGGAWQRLDAGLEKLGFKHGDVLDTVRFIQNGGKVYWDTAGVKRYYGGLSKEQLAALKKTPDAREKEEAEDLRKFFRAHTPLLAAENARLAEFEAEIAAIDAEAEVVLISKALEEPREVRILPRGNWLDESGEVVAPAIPAAFGTLDTEGERATRLDLAEWLVSEDHPLTARVFVNRVWQLLLGRGISSSPGDFGSQGSYPANPELLDYLAAEFVESGWDVKALVKEIVMSHAYRQTSRPTPELREKDPYNNLFARQGRFRMDAESIRDNALAVSGLLVERIGGESAMPYQPDGYYAQLNFPKRTYVADEGEQQYRRGVYTHWQRTFLHPMVKAFDAPTREECTARRDRSNTPLQSLTLLNDPTFVEAARVFAERILREAEPSPETRVRWAYQTVLNRLPDPQTEALLLDVLLRHQAHYEATPEAAEALLEVGLAPRPEDLDPVQVAAHTSVARVILNLHETITRY